MGLDSKPFLRGRFHEAGAYISLGACAMLIAKSHNGLTFFATSIYSIFLIGLFVTSGLYHRINWNPEKRALMRRLDHAAIFGLIAGTATAIFALVLPRETLSSPLIIIWTVMGTGIVQAVFWSKAPKWLAAIFYVIGGWVSLPYVLQMTEALGSLNLYLIFTGGILYSIGAVIYATRKPNPWPKVFGYHEIFHLVVILAAAAHFIVINRLLK